MRALNLTLVWPPFADVSVSGTSDDAETYSALDMMDTIPTDFAKPDIKMTKNVELSASVIPEDWVLTVDLVVTSTPINDSREDATKIWRCSRESCTDGDIVAKRDRITNISSLVPTVNLAYMDRMETPVQFYG